MAKAAGAASKKPPSKNEVMASIAEATGLSKKQIAAVFEALSNEIKKSVGARGPGVFVIPGLIKVVRKKVPAKPAAKGVKNPLTGAIYDRPAKPASVKVAVRALKNLKSMV